jgi:phage shock protein PspC (stress-responsive transcriptional regulator)
MKKTLTVNLGGTVFHIDEDAYQLLEKYLSNLRIHFSKEEGTDEIMSDFELRISEILSERIRTGNEVITIEHVENVIKRMGKVEELFGEDCAAEAKEEQTNSSSHSRERTANKRFFRNPDDRILGGVCSGFAAYMGWDPTPIRILLFLLMFFYAVSIPLYIVLWLVVPLARTATERLQMRGESVTVENIGKTVTDGYERFSANVNDYMASGKPRSFFLRITDSLVEIFGMLVKVIFVVLSILLLPPLLFVLFIIVVVIIALIVGAVGGGFGLPYWLMPTADWGGLTLYPTWLLVVGGFAAVLLIGIPVIAAIYSICSYIFKFKPLSGEFKWGLFIFWLLALGVSIFFAVRYGLPLWGERFLIHLNPAHW